MEKGTSIGAFSPGQDANIGWESLTRPHLLPLGSRLSLSLYLKFKWHPLSIPILSVWFVRYLADLTQ